MKGIIHSVLEDHVRDAFCPNCRHKSTNEWKSEFWSTLHYITTNCSHCEYKIFYKTDVVSNGVHK